MNGIRVMAVALLVAGTGAWAEEPAAGWSEALRTGTPALDLRLRAEHVDNDAAATPRDATATTLRARLGYTTAGWNALTLALEYEGITAWDKLDYNDGTGISSQGSRPVIADPAGSELNQAWLRYDGIPGTTLQVGRQRLVLDNQRWVGNVGWRQNEQTYDGVVVTNRSLPGTVLSYAYVHNVNSVVSANFPVEAHWVNLSWSPGPALKITAYDYLLDFAIAAGNRQDSQTAGLRIAGTPVLSESVKLLYAAEYARQDGYADAPATVDADYLLAEVGAGVGPLTTRLGYEILGSNGGAYGLQTPLATLHAFGGWADLFLTTPAAGLRDAYVSVGGTFAGAVLAVVYHEFSADAGGADYGTELDASAAYPLGKGISGLVKYAAYAADAFGADTEKGWLQLEYRF